MNADDGHNRCFTVKLNSIQKNLISDTDVRLDFGKRSSRQAEGISRSGIIALPTEELNAFKLTDEECEEFNRRTAEAVKSSSAAANKKIAGVIGPSGILTEPFSETSFTELISGYDVQVKALEDFADLYVISDMTAMSDMRAALLSCRKTGKPVFVTVAAAESDSENGISPLGGLITAQEMGAAAYGVAYGDKRHKNGHDKKDAEGCAEEIKELSRYAKIPLIAQLTEGNADMWELPDFSGVKFFFCGEENAELIVKAAEKCGSYRRQEPLDDFFVFAHYGNVFFLEPDTTEISEPISCRPDMEEIISEACREACDVLLVEINSTDDAIDFAKNAHMSTLPVMFMSDNLIALKMALMLYQGTALIDSETLIPVEELNKVCKKYGAVVY